MNINKMENKVKVWIARDKDGDLYVYPNIPLKDECIWTQAPNIYTMLLRYGKFPSVKWEDDEPTEAYITLANESQPKPGIDWEQRRYEIVKDILVKKYLEVRQFNFKIEDDIRLAIGYADKIINELKKQSE